MKRQRFEACWKAIYKTWTLNRHCFICGCGKETLVHWITTSANFLITKAELNEAIEIAYSKGYIEINRAKNSYTKYRIK